jgi:uncharacterized protein YggE
MEALRRLGVFALAAASSTAKLLVAQQSPTVPQPPSVVTAGAGEVRLPPDWATVSFALQTRDQTAARAAALNRERLQRLVDTLGTLISTGDSVRVVALGIGPAENFERGEIVGYDAIAQIEVTLRNLDRLPGILDAAFAGGATSNYRGVEFKSDRAGEASRQALIQAFEDARHQAEALAQAADMTLGPLIEITTQPRLMADFPPRGFQSGVVTSSAASVTPSDVIIRATVQVSWRLQARGP